MKTPVPSPLEPGRLGPLTLRNRVIKSATYEGMSPGGVASEALIAHHVTLARGGVGMTTVAYCAVSPDGRTFADQLLLGEPSHPPLRRLTDGVHTEGAAASLQLGHCGFFTKLGPSSGPPRSASWSFNAYGAVRGLPFARPMDQAALDDVVESFVAAATRAASLGFDAVELHLGHGYLLSQFLSPATNRRTDAYGGSLKGRMKLPLEVVRRVRDALPPHVAVLAKTNLEDGFAGGLQIAEAIEIARALEGAGTDGLVLSGGFTSRSAFHLLRGGRPLAEMIAVEKNPLQRLGMRIFGPLLVKRWPFEELFYLPLAQQVRAAVSLPLVLLGGAVSRDSLDRAMQEGFEFVAMGRALIADPDLIARYAEGERTASRCTHCNRCIVEMDRGGVRCVLDDVEPR